MEKEKGFFPNLCFRGEKKKKKKVFQYVLVLRKILGEGSVFTSAGLELMFNTHLVRTVLTRKVACILQVVLAGSSHMPHQVYPLLIWEPWQKPTRRKRKDPGPPCGDRQGFHCPQPALQCHLSAFPWKDSRRRWTILAICVDAFINVIPVDKKYVENQTVIVETLQLHNIPSPWRYAAPRQLLRWKQSTAVGVRQHVHPAGLLHHLSPQCFQVLTWPLLAIF